MMNGFKTHNRTQVEVGENRCSESGGIKVCSKEIRFTEVRSPEIHPTQIRRLKIYFTEIGFKEIRSTEIHFPEMHFPEIRLTEIHSTQIRFRATIYAPVIPRLQTPFENCQMFGVSH